MEYSVRLVAAVMVSTMVEEVQYGLNEKSADDEQTDHTVARGTFF